MTTYVISNIAEDGTFERDGVRYRVVPEEPSVPMCDAMVRTIGRNFDRTSPPDRGNAVYHSFMNALAASTLDMSKVGVRVPERFEYAPVTDIKAAFRSGWNACLDALGIK